MYKIVYGKASDEVGKVFETVKTVEIADLEHALAFFDKVKRFAENHNLCWTVALWDDRWLVQSVTTNATTFEF